MYPDDTKIFRNVNNKIDSVALQHDLDQLVKWKPNGSYIFKVMHIEGDKISNRHYMMKPVDLQNTTQEKELGVWISNDLKASFHVAKAVTVSKAYQILGLIRRTFTHLDCQLLMQ